MKKKKNFTVIFILVLLTVIVVAGFSYAFYATKFTKNGTSSIAFSTDQLSLDFVDGPEISLVDAYPGQKVMKSFSVTNNGNHAVKYSIEIKDLIYEFEGFDIKYSITATNDGYTSSDVLFNPGSTYFGTATIYVGVTQEYTFILEFINQNFYQDYNQEKSLSFKLAITDRHPIYGIKRSLTSSSPLWERTDDSHMLYVGVSYNGVPERNDFNNIAPWSEIYSYNYDPVTNRDTARIGDSMFAFDGSNGEVLTYIPEFYYRRYQDSEYEYIQISKYPEDGFTKVDSFSVGRYLSSYDGTKLHSYSGVEPEVRQNINTYRTLSRAVGPNFGQLDYHYFIIQLLFLVEYANYNAQAVLGAGTTGLRSNINDKALVDENDVNRIIVATSVANYFIVGQQISIGTNINYNVARFRTITKIEDYDDGEVTGKAIYFDGDPVNIVVGNVIWSSPQMTGVTDSLGMYSGCLKSVKNPVIYRGIESIFGKIYQVIDGINLKDYVVYVSYDPTDYASNKYDGSYHAISYSIPTVNNAFSTKVGYDANNPLIAFPIEVGGGSKDTYLTDLYFVSNGNRIPMVGGSYAGGLWDYNFNNAYTYYAVTLGSRLLRY